MSQRMIKLPGKGNEKGIGEKIMSTGFDTSSFEGMFTGGEPEETKQEETKSGLDWGFDSTPSMDAGSKSEEHFTSAVRTADDAQGGVDFFYKKLQIVGSLSKSKNYLKPAFDKKILETQLKEYVNKYAEKFDEVTDETEITRYRVDREGKFLTVKGENNRNVKLNGAANRAKIISLICAIHGDKEDSKRKSEYDKFMDAHSEFYEIKFEEKSPEYFVIKNNEEDEILASEHGTSMQETAKTATFVSDDYKIIVIKPANLIKYMVHLAVDKSRQPKVPVMGLYESQMVNFADFFPSIKVKEGTTTFHTRYTFALNEAGARMSGNVMGTVYNNPVDAAVDAGCVFRQAPFRLFSESTPPKKVTFIEGVEEQFQQFILGVGRLNESINNVTEKKTYDKNNTDMKPAEFRAKENTPYEYYKTEFEGMGISESFLEIIQSGSQSKARNVLNISKENRNWMENIAAYFTNKATLR